MQHQTDLLEELDKLITRVGDDNTLPEQVRTLVHQRLESVRNALKHLDVYGPDGVDEATACLLGTLSATGVTPDQNTLRRDIEAFAKRTFQAVSVVDVAYGGGQAIAALGEAAHRIIDGG